MPRMPAHLRSLLDLGRAACSSSHVGHLAPMQLPAHSQSQAVEMETNESQRAPPPPDRARRSITHEKQLLHRATSSTDATSSSKTPSWPSGSAKGCTTRQNGRPHRVRSAGVTGKRRSEKSTRMAPAARRPECARAPALGGRPDGCRAAALALGRARGRATSVR
eukprot:356114-Chlamydomonas_euryale.AAC.13